MTGLDEEASSVSQDGRHGSRTARSSSSRQWHAASAPSPRSIRSSGKGPFRVRLRPASKSGETVGLQQLACNFVGEALEDRTLKSTECSPDPGSSPGPENLAEPNRARLRYPGLRSVVHVDDSESTAVSIRPLEVVHERPDKVTAHIDSCGCRR